MPPDDLELIERARQGDGDAFAQIMQRHEDRIFGLALKMMGNRQDALDATQEAFIAAYRRAGSFRGDAAFSTWLYRIAINTCRDMLRKRDRTPQPIDEEGRIEERDGATPADDVAGLRVDLGRALDSLSDEYKEAVLLHDVGGVPYEEIARLTGVAVGTVKSRISRGRRKLAQLLEQPPEEASSKGQR